MKPIHGMFLGCLLALPVGALAQDNAPQAGQPMAAPAEQGQMQQPMQDQGQTTTPKQTQEQTQSTSQDQSQEQAQQQTQQQTQAQTGFSRGSVAREAFTKGIENHEPTGHLKTLNNDVHKVYFFTDLRDMKGQTVTHRWQYNGKVMAKVHFKVGGPRWRVWSSKNLEPGWTGQWKVSVVNAAGQVIASDTLDYKPAPATSASQGGSQGGSANGTESGSGMPMKQDGGMSDHSQQPPMSGQDAMPAHDAMPSQGK